MDSRWVPISRDSQREVKILLHPTAAIHDVRKGSATDATDLSEFVQEASHSAFEARITLAFNRELFGARQPKPNQVLEIQLQQRGTWTPLWLGFVDSLNSFTMSRGERQLQLIAKTRDQQDIWRSAVRVTPLFPQLTNLSYMAQRVARMTDMQGDEIALPPSAIATAHSNTQLADMTAWDMVKAIFVALGWEPFIDSQGRLRAADRTLHGRKADIRLEDSRMVKVGGQRLQPPVTRLRVSWLDPTLKKWKQQGRILTSVPVTIGWFVATHTEKVTFSEDGTLRAENTHHKGNPGVEKWSIASWCQVTWVQQSAVEGRLHFDNTRNFEAYIALITVWAGASLFRRIRHFFGLIAGISQAAFAAMLLKMGPGNYEIWGTPYNFVHPKNASEAFDASVPPWVNRLQEIDCDLIANEEHGKAVAVRELIFASSAANKWSVTLVDDPRIEYGDLLQFPDGSKLYVEDYSRPLTRGSEAILEVKGFLVAAAKAKTLPKVKALCLCICAETGYGGPWYLVTFDGHVMSPEEWPEGMPALEDMPALYPRSVDSLDDGRVAVMGPYDFSIGGSYFITFDTQLVETGRAQVFPTPGTPGNPGGGAQSLTVRGNYRDQFGLIWTMSDDTNPINRGYDTHFVKYGPTATLISDTLVQLGEDDELPIIGRVVPDRYCALSPTGAFYYGTFFDYTFRAVQSTVDLFYDSSEFAYNDILVLRNGRVVIFMEDGTPPTAEGFTERVLVLESNGTLVHNTVLTNNSYACGWMAASSTDESFWVSWFNNDDQGDSMTFAEIETNTGAILRSWPLASLGADSPFFVVRRLEE